MKKTGPYNKWEAYSQSKTANILFSAALAERLRSKGIFSFSLDVGGGIYTNLGKHMTPDDFALRKWSIKEIVGQNANGHSLFCDDSYP
jgi:NAD(P)-dependent dehydrogenase (short-subunit alcohol dehydrogenase family)